MNVCGKVFLGERKEHLSQLYERRVVLKARVIVDDNSHVFHLVDDFEEPKTDTLRYRQSVSFLNR